MSEVKKIIYNCRHATLLIEKKQLAPLTVRERIELRLHLVGCSVCKLYQRQSIFISQHVKRLFHSTVNETHVLDDQYKKELQEQIDKKLK